MIASGAGLWNPASHSPYEAILWQLRLPRLLMGLLVGSTLSMTGAAIQGLFRNPLADPGLIGVSSGAALGAVATILLGGARLLPLAAFAGALFLAFATYRLATAGGRTSVATLLLAGVAINALAGAAIGFCTYLSNDAQLRSLTFWMLGSLGSASWKTLGAVAPFCAVVLAATPRMARALNALALGEAEAGHLGFRTETVKRWLLFLTAAGVGGCVAHTGMIGFVGLVIPHLVRLWIGPNHRGLLAGSALLGACVLVASDTLARTVVAPAELPIGIVTAAFGAPFFLGLLHRQRTRAGEP